MALQSLHYADGKFEVLDQLLLPHEVKYVAVKNCEDGWNVIRRMQVRGAPLIGIVAALSLAVELKSMQFDNPDYLFQHVTKQLAYLITSRPTAVNISDVNDHLLALLLGDVMSKQISVQEMKERVIQAAEAYELEDVNINKMLARHGAEHILARYPDQPLKILTHCNTGSLATGGYGTALGVVRHIHEQKRLEQCFFTETRPYNQGSRLTAFELVHDKIPATLICDSMAAALMKMHNISAVVVGADRVVANGDTANKIGTYQLAVTAKHHGVPFYVAAPSTSIDMNLSSGDEIVIEERPCGEMTSINGVAIAASGVNCWNPAFDVTPAELITGGIVTEQGVLGASELVEKFTTKEREASRSIVSIA